MDSADENTKQFNENAFVFPEDRWSHAKNFANELNESRLREMLECHKVRWSPERRARQAQRARDSRPWQHSTGPHTDFGKYVSSMNAWRHGLSSAAGLRARAVLTAQSCFVRACLLQHKLNLKYAYILRPDMLRRDRMLLDELMIRIRRLLERAGVDNPALDARIFARQGGGLSDADLIAGGRTPLSNQQIEKIEEMASRRAAGEPVSRILGEREFWSLSFKVTGDTLDPRPDTETLVAAALAASRKIGAGKPGDAGASCSGKGFRILDLGTGTGCILISLLKELPGATGVGIDLNSGAVDVARENARRHGVDGRADFRCGSWFGPLAAGEVFDLIVSNPPYIPESDIESLAVEVRNHDPILALSGGIDGLEPYKIILKDIKKFLSCGGRALFEIGAGQEKDLARLVDDSMMTQEESYRDLGGILRVVEIACGEK